MTDEANQQAKETKEQLETVAQTLAAKAAASKGGAQLDAAIDALNARVDAVDAEMVGVQASIADLEARVAALENGEPEPPEPPEPEKRYPIENDPDCGVPAGTQLTKSGSINITQANQVVENLDIAGSVVIRARGVVLRNCKISGGAYYLVQSRQDTSVEVHHCTITGTGASGPGQSGLDGTGHFHHNRITNVENGINIAGNGAIIEWNDIHALAAPASGHKDGIQADGSIDGLTIRNNRIDNPAGETSAVMLDNYWGPIRNVEVFDNFLGGGGFPAYVDGGFKGSANATNIAYRRNDMRKGGYGYFYHDSVGTQYVREGNVDYLTGANVDSK